MDYINPIIKVNAGGIPRLEALNVPAADSNNDLTYDFKNHRFLNYPYAGLIIFKLPKVTAATAVGNVYFTTDGTNKVQLLQHNGTPASSQSTRLTSGGIFLGWYDSGQLYLVSL